MAEGDDGEESPRRGHGPMARTDVRGRRVNAGLRADAGEEVDA